MLPENILSQIQNQQAARRVATGDRRMPSGRGRVRKSAPVDKVSNIVKRFDRHRRDARQFPQLTDLRLVQGQTVTVSVALAQIAGAVTVPRDAVNVGPDTSFVYVLGKDGKALSRTVKVLNDDGVNDAIQGDVKPGDNVITDGQIRVVPGQKVRVQTKRKAAPESEPDGFMNISGAFH